MDVKIPSRVPRDDVAHTPLFSHLAIFLELIDASDFDCPESLSSLDFIHKETCPMNTCNRRSNKKSNNRNKKGWLNRL